MKERFLQRDKQVLDLIFLTLLAVFSEVAGNGLLKLFPNTGYRLSLAPLIYFLALVRWGKTGGVVGITSSLATLFFLENDFSVNLILRMIPSLLLLLPFFFIKGSTRDRVGKKVFYLWTALTVFYLLQAVGYGLAASITGGSFLGALVDSFFPQTLDLVISMIIVRLMNERDLIFQNMEKYLEKSRGEEKREVKWQV